jgi:protein-tyrosine kinase
VTPRPTSTIPTVASGGHAGAALPDDEPTAYVFSPELVELKAPGSKPAVALRDAASQLISQHIRRGRRGVAVCGVLPGVGVSFVAANLAVALSQTGMSTLLIDGNFESPSLEHLIAPNRPALGLQDLLRSNDLTLADILHPEVLPSLSVIYAGEPAPDGNDLMGSFAFSRLVRDCMRDHEFTIVDTAAASRSAGARCVAAITGYALIVARSGASHADGVRLLSRSLADDGVEVIGAILNGA